MMDFRLSFAVQFPAMKLLVISEIGDRLWQVNYLGLQPTSRSTEPCIPPGSAKNRVPPLPEVKAKK